MDISARHGVYESLVNNRFSPKLIISLSGLGDLDRDEIRFESVSSIEKGAPDTSSIFVRDTSRSWYTNESGFDGLVEFINAFIEHNHILDVTVYGVSMGGFGAIVLARYINANRVIAISPRTVLGKACTFDGRLSSLVSKLNEIRHDRLSNIDLGDTDVTIISSIDVMEDAAHAAMMAGTKATLLGAHGDHNVSLTLKLKGLLPRFMQACIEGKIEPKDFGFFELSNDLAEAIKLHAIENRREESALKLNTIPDNITPSFLYPELYRTWLSQYISSLDGRNFEARHAYPAHTGQVIEGRSLIPYIGNGWAGPEEFGVWGVGLNHSIRLELIDLHPGDRALVVVYGKVFNHKDAPQIKLEGYINGHKSIDTVCTADAYQLEAIVNCSIVNIDLFTANPCSPKSIGVSDDDRELSIAVTKIVIAPRPPL